MFAKLSIPAAEEKTTGQWFTLLRQACGDPGVKVGVKVGVEIKAGVKAVIEVESEGKGETKIDADGLMA